MNSDDECFHENYGDSHPPSKDCETWSSDEDKGFVLESPNDHVEPEDFAYKVLSVDQIVQHQRNIIDEVNNVLNLSPQVTRTILNHFKWDKERLFDNYFESSSQEFFQSANVLNPFEQESPPKVVNTLRPAKKACEICLSACEELKGLGCGDSYCASCWKQYLANKTCSEGQAHTITCPAPNCDILVDYFSFLSLADNLKVKKRYKQLITNTFVQCNMLMRWCPAPNCSHAIEVNYMEPKAVECKCGHQFCFGCGENWHEPVSCTWLKKWLKVNTGDLETKGWIAQNTKECPKCKVAIQKDGGCNHMACNYPSCRYDFCWLCLGSWKSHSSSSCNSYVEEEGNRARLELYRSMQGRYNHYNNRYMNHMQSRRMEHELYAEVQAKIDEMKGEITKNEVQFLRNAVDVLRQCRTTLTYSYVFAFYVENNNQKIIFEINQRDLEIATENLSECLEREITAKNLYDIKQKVLDLTHYCRKLRHVLLSQVREGNEKDWWDGAKETVL